MKLRHTLSVLFIFAAGSLAAALEFPPGQTTEFQVELPDSLRQIAGEGKLSAVTHAQISVAVPEGFTPGRAWPIVFVNATSDPEYRSSRRLASHYTEAALAAGWVIVAADPVQDIEQEQDTPFLRYALVRASWAALAAQWPGAARWPFALAGFSGGSKTSGYLAAMFALEGQIPIGVYQAGINQETVASSAKSFGVKDPAYTSVPVFLVSGTQDDISTPSDHRRVQRELRRAGFAHVKLETFRGAHVIALRPIRGALEWFQEVSAAAAKK